MTNTTGETSDVDSSSATAASNNNKIIPPSPLTSRATPSTSAAPSTPTPEERQKRQDRKVCYLRAAVILVLISATIIVATFVGWFVKSAEYHDFELQYEDSVAKVAMAFQHRINMKHNVAKTFSAMITSRYGNVAQAALGLPPIWPNVTIPNFQEQTAGSLIIADGRALSYNPIITQDVDRLEWEAHATESAWILGAPQLISPPPDSTWPNNRTVSFGIYSRDPVTREVIYDPGYKPESTYPNVMVPVWQIAPIKTNEKAVMFNLHSEFNRMKALDHMLQYKVPALTAILQLVQDVELRPSSILFYPVFDTFREYHEVDELTDAMLTNENNDEGDEVELMDLASETHENQKVVGSVSIVFSWDTLLNKILPDYIKGMIVVLESSTGQIYSYSISGDTVILLGEGDRHNPKYDEYRHTVQGKLLVDNRGQKYITFMIHLYPSDEFTEQYVTNRAAIYAAGTVLIFLFTASVFLLYDYLVEDRQQRTARMARQSGSVVDSLFPASFRERLYKNHGSTEQSVRRGSNVSHGSAEQSLRQGSNGDVDGNITGRRRSFSSDGGSSSADRSNRRSSVASGSTKSGDGSNNANQTRRLSSIVSRKHPKKALKQIDKFLKGLGANSSNETNSLLNEQRNIFEEEPIADLFPDTSIMFSDIVGFTEWSSERTPHEVFQLLEQIFWEFDELAARHNVFKLGTIGDCYIAVTGIPEPVDEHAVILTRFAFDARDKVRQVCSQLDSKGLNTAKLDMRFGIHSGSTTAGILRGTKSRFELFGDTINTASRMESTGLGGKIQISEETAVLIRQNKKERWLTKRPNLISAKGKGELQTWWAEPERAGCRVSFSGVDGLFGSNSALNDSGRQLSELAEEKVEEKDELDMRSEGVANDGNSSPASDENV